MEHFIILVISGLERKLISEKTVSGYQPFSAVQEAEGPDNPSNQPPRIKNLYDTFASQRDREERGLNEKQREKPEKPRQGNTVYVSGHKITEDYLRKHFSNIGTIVNISMEIEKKYVKVLCLGIGMEIENKRELFFD